jgi:hypothetical protein
MNPPCADLDAYLDESLAGVDRDHFERHLLDCAICQAAAEDFMQLLAAGAELSQRADRPYVVPSRVVPIAAPDRPTRRRWAAVCRWLAIPSIAASVATLMLVWPSRQPALEDEIFVSLAPHRSVVERLPYAPLDRYRPYDVHRGARDQERISSKLTAAVEEHRGPAALVAVYLAKGELADAERELARSGPGDELDLDRAVLALARNQHAEALRYLDEVLARSPRNGVALWDRARVLTELRLPLAAAEDFEDVVKLGKLGELGWSIEAMGRAGELRRAEALRAQRWQAGKRACEHLSAAHLPDPAVVRASTSVCRPAFYEAVRLAPSREDVVALLPVAEALDAAAGNGAARSLVREVAAADPVQRRRAVAAWLRLTKTPDLATAEKRHLLDQLRASNQNDLVLGALRRAGLPGWRDEYVARAAASKDPFIVELGVERSAELLLAGGDPLGAEVELVRAVRECSKTDVELRCSYLYQALAEVYAKMNRPSDEREVAQAGLERSRRLGLYWDEKRFFDDLAEAARSDGSHALMRAYLREAALRLGGCEQARYAQETLAMASIDELRFPQARDELTLSPACDGVPTADRARVVAELARIDGTAEEAAALRAGLARTRARPDQTPGQLAYLDALEGRLLAARDPGAARPLLQHAIAVADRLGRSDMDGMKARADAYASLLVLAGNEGDHAATLALFARAAGTPLRGPCVVGVMVDAERVLVVTRDRAGKIEQRFDPKGHLAPQLDEAALVPEPLVHALSACERIDVLALPPVFGLPKLLPPDLAWSYRGRSSPPETPLSPSPHVVTVADTLPPRELDLAPLQALTLTPIPGASHVDLRGAEATPARALGAFAGADVVEIHAHGFIDLKRSDASLIALSPQADGRFALSAREVADLTLPRAPLVVLAACRAAYAAPYRHEPWGLPHAFLLAGARAVLASPELISDAEAGGFFRAVEQRILAGTDPAIALRDERARQLARDPSSWTRAVLLFD